MLAELRRVLADLGRPNQQLKRTAEPAAPAGDDQIVYPPLGGRHLRQAKFRDTGPIHPPSS